MSEPHEMEERIAAKLQEEHGIHLEWANVPEDIKDMWRADAYAILSMVRQEQETLNEAMIVAGGDIITREYGESDWEEAKDMAEGLNPNPVYLAMIRAWWLSHTAPQEK